MLTPSASLVMGYFSRLEMISCTATMFRICKNKSRCQTSGTSPGAGLLHNSPFSQAGRASITETPPAASYLAPRASTHLVRTSVTSSSAPGE